MNRGLFKSIIKKALLVLLLVTVIVMIVALVMCTELTREGIHIDLIPLFNLVSRSISR